MRKSKIELALDRLNEIRGLKYPDVGYCYYADVKGDGRNIRSVWRIINAQRGVSYSEMNGATDAHTLANIEATYSVASVASFHNSIFGAFK